MESNVTGSDFMKRVDELLAQKGKTRTDISKALGINASNMSIWYTKGSIPKVTDALLIADFLDVDVEYLVFGKQKKGVTNSQRELLRRWDFLTRESKEAILCLMDFYIKKALVDTQDCDKGPKERV